MIYKGSSTYKAPGVYNGPGGIYTGDGVYNNGAVPAFELLRLAQSVVSMLCYDGTDGKGNAYQLTPVFDDGQDHAAACTWSSSNPAAAVVSGSGVVSAVFGGSGNVVISCTWKTETKACLFTIYPSFPSAATLYAIPGGNYVASTYFRNQETAVNGLGELVGTRFRATRNTSVNGLDFALFNDTKSVYHDMSGGNFYRWNRTNAAGVYTDTGFYLNAVSGSPVDIDFITAGPHSANMVINGTTYTGFPAGSYGGPTDPALVLLSFVSGQGDRVINLSFATSDKTAADLSDRSKCPLFYVPQNFVKFTDYDRFVNYTEILNFGTAAGFNISSNNVPAGWFL